MQQKNNSTTQLNQPLRFAKPLLLGAGIALILISFFLIGVKNPDPEWRKLWMIKPLILVPAAGAVGGIFYSFMHHLNSQGKLNKALAIVLCTIIYFIVLWPGTVLGLNGTMWH